MSSDEGRANRRSIEIEQRRLDLERQAPTSQAPAPEQAAPGTIAWNEQQAEASRAELANARDLSSPARLAVDRVWAGLREACVAKFGRAPSPDSWDQGSDAAAMALSSARNHEAIFLKACASSTASKALVAELREKFYLAVRVWQGEACRNWPPKAVYEKQEARRRETW